MSKLFARLSFAMNDVLTYVELRQADNFELVVKMYTSNCVSIPVHTINEILPPAFCHTMGEIDLKLSVIDTITTFLNWCKGDNIFLIGYELSGEDYKKLRDKEIQFLQNIKCKKIAKNIIKTYTDRSFSVSKELWISAEEIRDWGVDRKEVFRFLEEDFYIAPSSTGTKIVMKSLFNKD